MKATTNKEENKFQHYHYSKGATQMITSTGKKFSFVGHKFMTQDTEVIEYLDDCIKSGLKEITKGALLTAEESDPMAEYNARVIKEHEARKAAILSPDNDRGNTEDGKTTQNLGAASSSDVPKATSNSRNSK